MERSQFRRFELGGREENSGRWAWSLGARSATAEPRKLPARWLRKEFAVDKGVERATVSFSGLGLSNCSERKKGWRSRALPGPDGIPQAGALM